MKIVHIISNLGRGGAETTLYKVLINDKKNIHFVISLKKGGDLSKLIINQNLSLYDFDFKFYKIKHYFYIKNILKDINPDLVQTWMYHSDFLGSIFKIFLGYKCLWCVRTGIIKLNKSNFITIFIRKLCSLISKVLVDKIIYCSENSNLHHVKIGYDKTKSKIIPNGYDFEFFKEQSYLKNQLKLKYEINDNEIVIGIVGRMHEQKNHIFFLNIIEYLKTKYKLKIKGVIIVPKLLPNITKKKLDKFIENKNLLNDVIFLDGKNDLNLLLNIIDINLLCSSWGEAFPNVVCETILTGIPNICFNIGDVNLIVKNKNLILDELIPIKFAEKVKFLIDMKNENYQQWKNLKIELRDHVKLNFSINKMINSYQSTWEEVGVEK